MTRRYKSLFRKLCCTDAIQGSTDIYRVHLGWMIGSLMFHLLLNFSLGCVVCVCVCCSGAEHCARSCAGCAPLCLPPEEGVLLCACFLDAVVGCVIHPKLSICLIVCQYVLLFVNMSSCPIVRQYVILFVNMCLSLQ